MKIQDSDEDQTVIVPAKGGRSVVNPKNQNLIKSNYDYGGA